MRNLYINTEYLAPKWRAYIVPSDDGFRFSNDLVVLSMWDLKKALLTFGDDVVAPHIVGDKNEIADWIRFIVKDVELADEMQLQNSRWGLVVALERQMMRTLNLPEFVAKRWLEVKSVSFHFSNGVTISSLSDLGEKIDSIPEEVFQFHYQRHPNDLSIWLSSVVGDYYLAESLEEAVSKDQITHIVNDHLEMILDAAQG